MPKTENLIINLFSRNHSHQIPTQRQLHLLPVVSVSKLYITTAEPTQIVIANAMGSLQIYIMGHRTMILELVFGAEALPQGGRRRREQRGGAAQLTAGLWE